MNGKARQRTHQDAHQGLNGHAGVGCLAGGGGAVDWVSGQLFQVAKGGDELGDEEVFLVWGKSADAIERGPGTRGSRAHARRAMCAWVGFQCEDNQAAGAVPWAGFGAGHGRGARLTEQILARALVPIHGEVANVKIRLGNNGVGKPDPMRFQ